MTALTRNVTRPAQSTHVLLAALFAMPVLAAAKVYLGAMVGITPAGYLTNATADASLRIVGVYQDGTDSVDNTSGASGDLTLVPTRGAFYMANSSSTDAIVDADIGRACYVVDNNTVARTSNYGARPVAGRVIGVDSAGVLVEIGPGMDPQADCDLLVLASADLSAIQFYGVDLANSSGSAKALAISAAGQRCVGILQNAPASGAVAIIRPLGCGRMSKMISGGSVTSAQSLGCTSTGKAKAAAATSVSSTTVVASNLCGVAMISGSSDGDVIQVLLIAQGIAPTTAA